jgi:hypothetical protein
MFEMTVDIGPPSIPSKNGPTIGGGDGLNHFVRDYVNDFSGSASVRPISFQMGTSVRVAYLVEGMGALARVNLRRLPGDLLWRGLLHWGPRGARKHLKFQVVGPIHWVLDPEEYTWQGRARRK